MASERSSLMFCVEKGPQARIGLRCDLKLTVFVVLSGLDVPWRSMM